MSVSGTGGGGGSAKFQTFVDVQDASERTPLGPRVGLARGDSIDRYIALDLLGTGSVGIVLKAFDPKLERSVAIKLLRSDAIQLSDVARERLMREGRAIAQLNHPHVVGVYDVGVFQGEVFVAMEYVAGMSLRQWLAQTERTGDEVVKVFAQAARGLAAAHAKGIVHRDFKPDNVLVGDDGRVRVADFGIARSGDPDDPVPELEGGLPVEAEQTLTRTGHILGTPAYMAPEQFEHRAVDARTDQWAFCVALYEALVGERPFAGDSLAELSAQVSQGALGAAPPGRVPSWLWPLLRRGMSVEGAERLPSMDVLADELERDRTPRRRGPIVLAAVVAVAAAAAVAFAMARPTAASACTGAPERFSGVWDDAMRSRVQGAFGGIGHPHAADAFERVGAQLDGYRAAWVDMRRQSCEASRAGDQSSALLDLRAACLDDRLARVKALTAALAAGIDREGVDQVVQSAYALESLAACDDARALVEAPPLPDDPAVRAQIDSGRAVLDQVEAHYGLGRYKTGLALLEPALAAIEATDYAPVRARALFLLGRLHKLTEGPAEAEAAYHRAAVAAAAARDDVLLARIYVQLAEVVVSDRQQLEVGDSLLAVAEAAVGRVDDALLRAELLRAQAGRARMGETERARSLYEQSLALFRATRGEQHPDVAGVMASLGIVARAQGKYDDAQRFYEQSIAMNEALFGKGHPQVAYAVNSLGVLFLRMGKRQEARAQFERCLAIRVVALGDDHPYVMYPLLNLAVVAREEGHDDVALGYLERALVVAGKHLDPRHLQIAYINQELGIIARHEGRWDDALRHHQVALDIWTEKHGANDSETSFALTGLGATYRGKGDLKAAIPYFERSLAVRADALPRERSEALFDLAEALWDANVDRPRARRLALEARAVIAASDIDDKADWLADYDDWLARHK